MALTGDFGPEFTVRTPISTPSTWDFTLTPPALQAGSPLIITSKATLDSTYTVTIPETGGQHHGPAGLGYKIVGDGTKDCVIDLRGEGGGALPYHLEVYDFLNLYLIGISWDIVVPAAGGIGLLPGGPNDVNIHPRMPGQNVCRLSVRNHIWVEGCDVYCGSHSSGVGIECDYFVWRGEYVPSAAAGSHSNVITFQQCRMEGAVGGSWGSGTKDAVHSDMLQNQGQNDPVPTPKTVRYENTVVRKQHQGVTIANYQGYHSNLSIRNASWTFTEDFNAPGTQGSSFWILGSDDWEALPTIVNMHYENETSGSTSSIGRFTPTGSGTGTLTHWSASDSPNPIGFVHPELHYGTTGVNFGVTRSTVGYNYTSPHADVW